MIKKLKSSTVMAAGFFLSLGFGFMLSGASVAGVASFADISLAGAVNFPSASAVLAGSLVHSIISGNAGRNIVKISSMVLIVIAKLFFESVNKPKICGIVTGAAVFISGTAVSLIIGEAAYKLPFYIFYGLVSGYAAYSAAIIIMGLKKQLVLDLSGSSGCAYAIVYTIFIASLCSAKLPFFNAGIIIGSGVTLFAAYYYRCTGGVLCGALTTCGAFLADSEVGMTVVLLPAAGLLMGYLYKLKASAAAGFFVLANFLFMILAGLVHNNLSSMINILSGTILFMFAAPNYSDKWVSTGNNNSASFPEILNVRMNFLSDSIESVRDDAVKISERLCDTGRDYREDSQAVMRKICGKCEKNSSCSYLVKSSAARAYSKLAVMPEAAKETFPAELAECLHSGDIQTEYRKKVRERMTRSMINIKLSENQQLLNEQIRVTEEIIRTSGEKINLRYSDPLSKQIKEKLERHNINPEIVVAYYNAYNRLIAEIYFRTENAPESCTRICDLVSDEIGTPLEFSEPAHSGQETRFRIFENPAYSMEVYGASMCAENSLENGDTSTVFTDGTGTGYVILSDGMGSGSPAAIESRMVVRMFRRLISSGVGYPAAVKLINSIMLTKSKDETFATLDAVKIDLDSCELTVIKSGASATLIRHRGNVLKVTSPTFPIGINEQSEIFSGNYEFEEGDIIIMFSDGINENEYLFIKELLLGSSDIKKIVNEICSKAEVFNPSLRQDDITVIGIKVQKNS